MHQKVLLCTQEFNADSVGRTLLGSNPRTVLTLTSKNVVQVSCATLKTGVKMLDIGTQFCRIQEILNEWCKALDDDDRFYPKKWALEKLWMDVEILKAAVHVILSSSGHDEDLESL